MIHETDIKRTITQFQRVLWQNLNWFLTQHSKTLFLRGFFLNPTERALANNGDRDFQNSPLFARFVFMSKSLEILTVFKTFILKIIFEKRFFFQKSGVSCFS